MRRLIIIGAGVGVALIAYRYLAQTEGESTSSDAAPDALSGLSDALDSVGQFIAVGVSEVTPYQIAIALPKNQDYVDTIRQVENQKGIPPDLMVRLAYQECRFRADIIEGRTVSSAGAKGMWQLMPIHWKFVDPLDWRAAAVYAAGELLRLNRRFNSWQMALAAYNWGEGNLSKFGLAQAPKETRDYYQQIMADIGMNGSVLA